MRKEKITIIGICGGSCSGKTSTANYLKNLLNATIISLDDYIFSFNHLTLNQKKQLNYDLPHYYNHHRLAKQLKALIALKTINKPIYSFSQYCQQGSEIVKPNTIIIVEGLYILKSKQLRKYFDLSIFIDLNKEKRLQRRVIRDVEERKRTIEFATNQFLSSVEPMHVMYVQEQQEKADITLNGDNDFETNIALIKKQLSKIKTRR